MFPKKSTPSTNLDIWRDIRLKAANSDSATEVARWFDTKVQKMRYIDYYTPESWPNVFEIVSEGMYCQSSAALILAATLFHLGFVNTDTIRFDLVSNHITGDEGLVLVLDNMYYSFEPGKVHSEEYVKENSTTFCSHIITVDKLFR